MLVIFLGVVAVTALTLGTITTSANWQTQTFAGRAINWKCASANAHRSWPGRTWHCKDEVAERKQKERDLHHAREKLRRRAEEISRLASIVEASTTRLWKFRWMA